MHQKYLPNNLTGKLDHIVEEIGEVLAAIGKTQRFGPLSFHPDKPNGEKNIEWLMRELDDLKQAIIRFEEHAMVDFKNLKKYDD